MVRCLIVFVFLQLLEEVGRIHSTASISFTDGFNQIVPKVLALAQGKSPLAKQYLEARDEALTEVEEAMISSFYSYFVFNLEYQPKNKNTLTFLQRCIAKINAKGDRPLPTTVTRVINLLF